jgi:uncharacterized membrane protein YfcA
MNVTPVMLAMLVGAGVLTGVIGAMLGTGGGVFLVPVLVIGLKMPMHHAIATSIVTVIATSSATASANVDRGTANMRLGMVLEVGTALGAIAGGLTAALISPRALEGLFALVLLPVAALMWRGRNIEFLDKDEDAQLPAESDAVAGLGASFVDSPSERVVTYRVRRLGAGLGISFVAGNLSGLLGIGGGVFKVPALHLLCGVPIKAAAATSNFMIGVTAATSAFLYYGRGEVWPAPTAAATVGVLAGSALGSALNRRVHGGIVTKLFAVLLLAVALQMLFRAIVSGG